MPKTWLVIPVKNFSDSKQRLQLILNESQRRSLAVAMLKDMLDELKTLQSSVTIVLLSRSEEVKQLAQEFELEFLLEPEHCRGLNHALQFALEQAEQAEVSRAVLLHGDIPLLKASDIARLLQNPSNTIAADKHGSGTNALLLHLPNTLPLCFGENSFALHRQKAKQNNSDLQHLPLASLQWDIDEPQDFSYLQEHSKTQSWVGQWFANYASSSNNETVN